MKKIVLIFVILLIVSLISAININLISASLCKGNNGYYQDCYQINYNYPISYSYKWDSGSYSNYNYRNYKYNFNDQKFIYVEKSQTTPFKAWTFRASKNPNKHTPLGVGKTQGFFDYKDQVRESFYRGYDHGFYDGYKIGYNNGDDVGYRHGYDDGYNNAKEDNNYLEKRGITFFKI